MHIKDWKKEVFTIPNLLSLFRLALIPVYIYIYLGATETGRCLAMCAATRAVMARRVI